MSSGKSKEAPSWRLFFWEQPATARVLFVVLTMSLGMSLVACAGAQPGEDRLLTGTLHYGGFDRQYLLYVPRTIADRSGPRPLVLVLHGGGGTARGMVRLTYGRFNELADEHGFYVVYPQGVGKSWNDGRPDPISRAHAEHIDDVAFIEALIGELRSEYPIDARRVFATGISNGGLMSFRLGCSIPGTIRAIAPVTASIPSAIADQCKHGSGVGLALFNGTTDPLVPYAGGQIRVFGNDRGEVLSTEETISIWIARNGCGAEAARTLLPDRADDGTRVEAFAYRSCSSGTPVVLYRIEGGGHTWPGGRQYLGRRLVGRTSRDINASDEIWKFFSGSF